MANHVLVENSVVSSRYANGVNVPDGYIEAGDEVRVGWLYDGTVFSEPGAVPLVAMDIQAANFAERLWRQGGIFKGQRMSSNENRLSRLRLIANHYTNGDIAAETLTCISEGVTHIHEITSAEEATAVADLMETYHHELITSAHELIDSEYFGDMEDWSWPSAWSYEA